MRNLPIGVFDSGIGGLTVVKEIINELPNESIIYLGDTARVPYGTRGKKVITKFALELVQFLLKRQVKILVVACNTISATCLEEIKKLSPIPVLGVIKPAARQALKTTRISRVGIIGTKATISSGVYEKELGKEIQVIAQACPLFVPLAEEGLVNSSATKLIARTYLKKFSNKIDTLILGCTHYPVLKKVIQQVVGKKITLIDSAQPTAKLLKKLLEEKNLLSKNKKPHYQFFVTDSPQRVYGVASQFFGTKLKGKIKKVTL